MTRRKTPINALRPGRSARSGLRKAAKEPSGRRAEGSHLHSETARWRCDPTSPFWTPEGVTSPFWTRTRRCDPCPSLYARNALPLRGLRCRCRGGHISILAPRPEDVPPCPPFQNPSRRLWSAAIPREVNRLRSIQRGRAGVRGSPSLSAFQPFRLSAFLPEPSRHRRLPT